MSLGLQRLRICQVVLEPDARNHPKACMPGEYLLLFKGGSAVIWVVSSCVPALLVPPPPPSPVNPQHGLSLGRGGFFLCFWSDLVEPMLFGT